MKEEYLTVRLFKNHRAVDDLITNEELCDTDQQQSSEEQYNSGENSEISKSNEDQNESSLPQRLLNGIRRALKALGLDCKD